ncbi:threonine dehydrogenase-like Zn-dependent dehydrogenase [Actinoplanes campanulatus]|uniref:Threonine dehydrogenase-like Zn-dependent dehydrogenase n=1 Tax=Actinoplanes campanulatus TaxID=113559 RepID=A0A7W5AN65_9ACTN|nr:zinc-binding dehydrogenase [Actinoplanes campanulatus]MBB3099170.1 threonine dehydrogenase-like Zn-dependent dehydrogenase [Actinoplanes campanulatus]GGN38692.1 dehydrogenase [Actinoplanes campanulatus]GID40327.1 dehydrogenase [Actinoplanes campanulatus]
MRAVILHDGKLSVGDVPLPEPGRGQIRLKVTRTGICGSDLHVRLDAEPSADVAAEVGYPDFIRSSHHVVMGHEFTGTVDAYGPGCRRRWKPGQAVVSLPLIKHGDDVHMTGMSSHAPGGYAEYLLVSEAATMPVPNGLDPDLAALTEPLAVAYHAVRRGDVAKDDTAVVIGCGPIGLAVILMLKAAGVRRVVAGDFSGPRRDLARTCGADVVVDPAVQSPWDVLGDDRRLVTEATALYGAGIDAMDALQRIPGVPWWTVMRAGQRFGAGPRGAAVFECVGVPGVIEDIVTHAPFRSRIVVVGVCMQPDTFRPTMASNKEVDLRFSFCYDPAEFRDTLHMVARRRIDPRPLITGVVGLDGVADAFDQLAKADSHAKILVNPHAKP